MKSYIKQSLSILSLITALSVTVALSGCGSKSSTSSSATSASVAETTAETTTENSQTVEVKSQKLSEDDITIKDTVSNDEDGAHAITADGETASYSGRLGNRGLQRRSGQSERDEPDD